ncbi:hypothetical protein A1Q1_05471 [Trichosporon asahii var. asahii CBS 2479]|uniref:DUF3492 domain-containing protein n=1 Tax=Trichosporon asahii var. asahii (strain ATCC 90039 / CBS 2479 / JCM 2466 / KCTC 7840 / NBRC 103889/ NCYC 2677 / UAMH 7654) TaxID=1186058 RepID=J5TQZ6_TRIAS|nr:hypothetical protein A1Q1_05471 [Trichosporon asahii var. asahii CBS 2479]EJT52261.1 hypothetical protein A1Q1_05471 [Trichosporon asahii var. asahii CBS 2479]
MATFFQPGFEESGGVTNCTVNGFEVFCNAILPSDRRLAHWYQGFSIVFAAVTFCIPIILYGLYRLIKRQRRPKDYQPVRTKPKESEKERDRKAARMSMASRRHTPTHSRQTSYGTRLSFATRFSDSQPPSSHGHTAPSSLGHHSHPSYAPSESSLGTYNTVSLRRFTQQARGAFSFRRNRDDDSTVLSHRDSFANLSLRGSLKNTKSFTVLSDFDFDLDYAETNKADFVVFPLHMPKRDSREMLTGSPQLPGSPAMTPSDMSHTWGTSVRGSPRIGASGDWSGAPRLTHAPSSDWSHTLYSPRPGSEWSAGNGPQKMKLGAVDLEDLTDDALSLANLGDTVVDLLDRFVELELNGFALRVAPRSTAEEIDSLVDALHYRGVSSIVCIHEQHPALNELNLELPAGLIVENACILPSGEPRDFFQARPLRDLMADCARERQNRPEFFVGFLDQWENRPHPAVIRRAIKIAEHYGAVFEHRPRLLGSAPTSTRTIGGFEYLRRPEIVDLQRSWASDSRPVELTPAGEPTHLPLAVIERVIPGVGDCLVEKDLPEELARLQYEVPQLVPAPEYMAAYREADFWTQGTDGAQLSEHGCFPLCSEPHEGHYAAIVAEQSQLRALGMLYPVQNAEEQAILSQLRSLAGDPNADILLHELIHGLSTRTIRIHKGLHSGFRAPDANAAFWGVCAPRHDPADPSPNPVFDIFISQSAPNDAAVVLHTWLAHHGRSRVTRLIHEVVLENLTGGGHPSGLPNTVRTALEGASTAELLLILQQLRLSGDDTPFGAPIRAFATELLMDGTSKTTWMNMVARRALDGSMSMLEILCLRLEQHARAGAVRLPLIADLMKLYHVIDDVMIDSLYKGQHKTLKTLSKALLHVYGREPAPPGSGERVDVQADLFALIFFTCLRRAAFEDVYLESVDRCPVFLQQADQAAVFSELWTLGSQCENYFGVVPREIGDIIYHRRQGQLEALGGPKAEDRQNNEIMTMYASTDDAPPKTKEAILQMLAESSVDAKLSLFERFTVWRMRFAAASAMSIFCAPAIVDVILLTFVGRGLFMTAYMDTDMVQAAGYALLTALLLTAGVTGWVGSAGSHYLPHYAYDNIILFHVQRLAGGFVLAVIVSVFGCIGFAVSVSVASGFVFAAYLIGISTYLNLLGIMSTMHQHGSPLPSGRNVFLQTFPILFISPLLSSLVNGHDLEIYLPVMYGFLVVALLRYRRLCHQWSAWMKNIPDFKAQDITDWYTSKVAVEKKADDVAAQARSAFVAAIASYRRRDADMVKDPLVGKVARGMPYVAWLFKKGGGSQPEPFTTAWFTALGEAISQQRQLSRGLKDHSVMALFRVARYDLGQNLGLFLVALLDRWIMLVMGARKPYPSIYLDLRSRYAFCFCIVYFCLGSMVLDATLFKYWSIRDDLSQEKLLDLAHAQRVARETDRKRKDCMLQALADVAGKVSLVFGSMTILMWLFVDNYKTVIMFYMYMFGYSCCLLFQFNRCFTTNVAVHVRIILYSAAIGFLIGVLLHALPWTCGFLYNDIICQNFAAGMAALGTSLFTIKDWFGSASPLLSPTNENPDPVYVQPRLMTLPTARKPACKSELPKKFTQATLWHSDGTATSSHVSRILVTALNSARGRTSWSTRVMQEALNMWTGGRMTVGVLPRDQFDSAGLGEFFSISYRRNLGLHIAVCFSQMDITHTMLPNIVAECIVYHVAHVQLGLTDSQALHAECLLNGILSVRLQTDLGQVDVEALGALPRKSRKDLMRALCLGRDVDTEWQHMPPDARAAIIARIEGEPAKFSAAFTSWCSHDDVDVQTADFGVELNVALYQNAVHLLGYANPQDYEGPARLMSVPIVQDRKPAFWKRLQLFPYDAVKWIAIISGGGSNIEREIYYLLHGKRVPIAIVLGIWKCCWSVQKFFVYWILLYHRPALARIARLATKGARRKINRNRIVVELTRRFVTGFAAVEDDGSMSLQGWDGLHEYDPAKGTPLFVASYDRDFRLMYRSEGGAAMVTYHYPAREKRGRPSRRPTSVEVTNADLHSVGYYDKKGRVLRGNLTLGERTDLTFKYHYKKGNTGGSHLLRADYSRGGDSLSVFWGNPIDTEDYTWVPSKTVGLIVRRIQGRTYTTEFDYSHRRDPVATTYLEEGNGRRTALTEAPECWPGEKVLLSMPSNHSFEADDLLNEHSALQLGQMRAYARTNKKSLHPARWLSLWRRRKYTPVPTWRVRTELWNQWLQNTDLDAVTACTVDEIILREEPLLRPYWRARDRGRLPEARKLLDENISQIVSAIDIETDVSEKTLLAIRTSDLYAMGLAQDANAVTSRPQDCYHDTHDRISVIFNDIGCWPVAPGGVSNCRRDLVNGHSTIRNHVLAECANDYGIPRFQVEKSVQSLKLLPLWGLDGGTARHGVIDNYLESQVDAKVQDTDLDRDIVGTFVPLLDAFVKGCRMKRLGYDDLLHLSNVFLSFGKYYELKDYTLTWRSPEVEQAWIAAWMRSYDDPNIADPTECFDISRPSMFDFRQALYIYLAYFFIFSVGVPERCPRVFQSTHHGISSLFGMVLKYRRGVTFGIWDHAILWRESCLNFSVAQCQLPVAVQNMLLAGIGVATRLAYFHADVILPCASLFNPMWETELGSDGSRICARNTFHRKIDPIVNGISNMESFTPVDKVRTEIPTVVMLSNVQFIKGVKVAIQAADIIINKFGFKDYRLVVYGAKDRQPSYCLEMEKLIVDNNLTEHVVLAGFGKPSEVLKDAWLFMNSSISEGLPLAIGEAALAGVPIVATEVGATALVLTDPANPEQRYGEVVPPNDALGLARAQIAILSMSGPWAKFTDYGEGPPLPDVITPGEDVEKLTQRFYKFAEDRRKLGLLSREVVLHSFHGSRYLREHEQMYWIQWHLAQMRANKQLKAKPFRFGAPEHLRYIE